MLVMSKAILCWVANRFFCSQSMAIDPHSYKDFHNTVIKWSRGRGLDLLPYIWQLCDHDSLELIIAYVIHIYSYSCI